MTFEICSNLITTVCRHSHIILYFVIQGNEALFSLETASDYVKDEKACFYGFKCVAVGYEFNPGSDEVMNPFKPVTKYIFKSKCYK